MLFLCGGGYPKMRINSTNNEREKNKDYSKYILIAIFVAFIVAFFLDLAYKLGIIALNLIIRYWWGAIILGLVIIFMLRRRRKKKLK